jgi:hypothetical protein
MPDGRAGLVHRLTSQLATLRRLSWADRSLLLQAGLIVSVVRLALKVISFRRVAALLKLASRTDLPVQADRSTTAARVLNVARLVNMSSRHSPLASTCLHRSLTLWWLLNRRGFDARLQFGTRRRNGAFEAHAWVEHDGIVVGEDPDEHDFVRIPWEPLKNDS